MNGSPISVKPSPSSWWYATSVIFFLIPVCIGGFIFARKLSHLTDGLVQLVVPGSAELTLKHTGANTVFLEKESVVNGRIFSTNGSIAGLNCSVRSQDGSTVLLRRPTASTTYTLGGRNGRSVLEFNVAQPGTYHFECGYEQGQSGPQVVMAVGTGVGSDILVSLLAGFFGIGVGGAFAAIAAVTVYSRQRSNRQKMTKAISAATVSGY